MPRPVLGYWDLRGRADVLRLILHYAKVDYEDKQYVFGKGPEFDKSQWFDAKPHLGVEFPNLPYYFDGDLKITETSAILHYLARKYKLMGDGSDKMTVDIDTMESVAGDIFLRFAMTCYNKDYEAIKDVYRDTYLADKLNMLSQYLARRGSKWLAGDCLTFPDFIMFSVLDWHLLFAPHCLDKLSNLQDYHHRFAELPGVKEYLASDDFKKMKTRLFGRQSFAFNGNE